MIHPDTLVLQANTNEVQLESVQLTVIGNGEAQQENCCSLYSVGENSSEGKRQKDGPNPK